MNDLFKTPLTLAIAMMGSSAFAEDIKTSNFVNVKECSSSSSNGTPFQYHIFEIFDGIIFADYNIGDSMTKEPFNRLFKKLDTGEWYFRTAVEDQLVEIIISNQYSFKNTNLVTEQITYNYSNPNNCVDHTSETSLRFNNEAVVAHCEKEWTKRGERDEDQIQYCIDKQTEGFEDLRAAVEEYKETPGLVNMFDYLVGRWSERDFTNYPQVDYGLRLECESYLNIEYELKQDDEKIRPLLRDHLINRFDPKKVNYSQLEYSIEKNL